MSLIDSQTFLPGALTEVESDYSYGYDSSLFGTTDSVLVIGTAFNGPVGVPVEIYSPEHGRYVFGKAYDAKTKQEATLVSGIEDAYQRGSRTIYGVRISGKQVEKKFNLALDTNLQLHVSGVYPTNEAKDFFMVYDDTTGDERIRLYKPADRATIVEKMQGLVESENSVLVTEIRLNLDYGLTKDSMLTDLLRIVNEHAYNNVLRLTIVDENGADVTNTSIEAMNLPIGAMHPGVYFIGRDRSLCPTATEIDYKLVTSDADKPFESFSEVVFKRLVLNTDVSQPLPIFAENMEELRDILRTVEIFTFQDFDFLETLGVADRAFAKDKVDYEEVNISKFDIYQRLGSGFAITARAERRVDATTGAELTPKVKETPVSDANRVLALGDGIYSMLENLNTRYRVLTAANADTQITGKLPRPKDFLVGTPVSVDILNGLIKATPKIDPATNFTPKAFSFKVNAIVDGALEAPVDEIYDDVVFRVVPNATEEELLNVNVPNGTLAMTFNEDGKGILKRFNENRYEVLNNSRQIGQLILVDNVMFQGVDTPDGIVFEKLEFTAPTDGSPLQFHGKNYVLAENNGRVYALKFLGGTDAHVSPIGDIESMLGENVEQTTVYAQYNHFEANPIVISSALLDGTTVEEFVEYLNNHESLRAQFDFSLTTTGYEMKDEYVSEAAASAFGVETVLLEDRKASYDYTKYVPYKTNDNFARQLAQHATYTSLKTAPTHGVIGLNRMSDLSLNSLANRVEEILNLELDLYAKNAQGRNMLDRNNMPYPIGKNISVVFSQYYLNMSDGYRYVSNGAAGYAGMVSRLPLDQSSTSQPIELDSTMFELTNFQLTRLTQKGIITIRQSYTRGLVVTDGITQAPAESPFRRLSVTRVIGAVEELIREAVEPFIGKQNHAANRNSMQTAVKSNLDKIKDVLIEDYQFNMVIDPRVMKFSYIDIDYKIVPIYEIREVRNRISVKDEL
ncbi:hypothetical protein [Heyndrickxia sporothermodurans]|uniref:hypothetical protein n=1 Tax=Heyndrickxia sporothermodurans TaxID=46224 RepID=UPI000D39D45C|nr:hypothetical protein [Heyndrickxia sporothermodurans]PTY92886.1 hypothetical protein B5V90_02070 [Heyndrickxia sporothermodurans]